MTTSSIRTEGILCNQCGARLRIAIGTNYADCSYCGCQLKIHRSGGAVFSETIEEIKQAQRRSEDRITVLELTAQLKKLEEAWANYKTSTLTVDESVYLASKSRAGLWMFLVIILISASISSNLISDGESPVAVITMLEIFVALSGILLAVCTKIGNAKRRHYLAAKERYETKKSEITSEIAIRKFPT